MRGSWLRGAKPGKPSGSGPALASRLPCVAVGADLQVRAGLGSFVSSWPESRRAHLAIADRWGRTGTDKPAARQLSGRVPPPRVPRVAAPGRARGLRAGARGRHRRVLSERVRAGGIATATNYLYSFAEGNVCNKAIELSLQENVDCKSRLNFVLHFCTKELISETISQLATHL